MQQSSGRGRGGSAAFSLGGRSGTLLRLLLRLRFDRIVACRPLHHSRLVEEAQHAVGGLRALGEPALHLVEIELEAMLLLLLRCERSKEAEPLDETAIARAARIRHHYVIERPLLGARAREPDLQRHRGSFRDWMLIF